MDITNRGVRISFFALRIESNLWFRFEIRIESNLFPNRICFRIEFLSNFQIFSEFCRNAVFFLWIWSKIDISLWNKGKTDSKINSKNVFKDKKTLFKIKIPTRWREKRYTYSGPQKWRYLIPSFLMWTCTITIAALGTLYSMTIRV